MKGQISWFSGDCSDFFSDSLLYIGYKVNTGFANNLKGIYKKAKQSGESLLEKPGGRAELAVRVKDAWNSQKGYMKCI